MMKIFDKIYNWFFDRETDKEEECKMKSKISQIKKHNELERKWRQEFLNDCFGVIESGEQDCANKIKYYKRKVKIFHGLQGFNWEYAYNFAEYAAVMRSCGYIEITKEEYEENVK